MNGLNEKNFLYPLLIIFSWEMGFHISVLTLSNVKACCYHAQIRLATAHNLLFVLLGACPNFWGKVYHWDFDTPYSTKSNHKACCCHIHTHRVVGYDLLSVFLVAYPNFWGKLFRQERNTSCTPQLIIVKLIIFSSYFQQIL